MMPDTSLGLLQHVSESDVVTPETKKCIPLFLSHSRHSFQGLIQKSGALTSWYVKNIKQFDRTAMLHTLM